VPLTVRHAVKFAVQLAVQSHDTLALALPLPVGEAGEGGEGGDGTPPSWTVQRARATATRSRQAVSDVEVKKKTGRRQGSPTCSGR
jgi:hypothetical protein